MAKKQAANGSFAKPTGCFSQVSNSILRDSNLSLKAKGLYSLIVSYITLPDFTLYKGYLQAQCAEGRYSFDSTWRELVEAGYLTHQRTRLPDGTFYYEYALLSPNTGKDKGKPQTEKAESPVDVINVKSPLKDAKELSIKNSSVDDQPIEKNQAPVSPIGNKTLTNKTKSVLSDPDPLARKEMEKQIEYRYFLREPFFKGAKQLVISQLVDYLCSLKALAASHQPVEGLEGELLLSLLDSVDSCTICEFLVHMEERKSVGVRFPVVYWNKAFINYLKEEAYSLAIVGG